MAWFSGVLVFVMIWWTSLFVVLPWGVRRDEGLGTGAPQLANIKKKFLITTALAAVIWVIIFVLIEIELISFYDIGKAMFKEDFE